MRQKAENTATEQEITIHQRRQRACALQLIDLIALDVAGLLIAIVKMPLSDMALADASATSCAKPSPPATLSLNTCVILHKLTVPMHIRKA